MLGFPPPLTPIFGGGSFWGPPLLLSPIILGGGHFGLPPPHPIDPYFMRGVILVIPPSY